MATVRSLDGALDFEPRSLGIRRFFNRLSVYFSAIREGGDAAHAYEVLTRRGTPHDEAVQRVFDEHFDRR
jgi:hypothetical protein